jgi:hypothetical protein
MAADDKTPTGRDLDRELELSEARIEERVRMRLDSHQDEDTGIIEQRALSRAPKSESVHPRAKVIVAVLGAVKTPWQAVVMLAFIALLAYFVATAGPAIVDRVF